MSAGERPVRIVENVICMHCGCVCDDIRLRVQGGRIIEVERACERGEEGFLGFDLEEHEAAWVGGRPAKVEEAIEAAAELLSSSRAPLIFGLRDASSEAQELAVEIADRSRGALDIAGSATCRPWTTALQRRGCPSATLAEVKNRADLFVLCYVDPEVSHQRFFERFVRPDGLYVRGGRAVIGLKDAEGAEGAEGGWGGERGEGADDAKRGTGTAGADRSFQIPREQAFEAFWWLRAVLDRRVDPASADSVSGVPAAELKQLAERLTRCRYGAWLYDPGASPPDDGFAQAMFALVTALNEHVPFAAVPLGGPGNGRGAESVLTAQTGYPSTIDFAAGYPRFGPDEFSAPRILARREIDAVLVVGSDPSRDLPEPAFEALRGLPTILVDFRAGDLMREARAAVRCAPYAVAAPATVYRTDGIALRARPALESGLPSDAEILGLLSQRLTADGRRRRRGS